MTWVESVPEVLHFQRPGGWHCITNLGTEPIELPTGRMVLASDHLAGGQLPPDTTAWLVAGPDPEETT
jgi:alpha-glucosidase